MTTAIYLACISTHLCSQIKRDTLVNIDHNGIIEACHNGKYPPAIAMVMKNIHEETVIKINIESALDERNETVEHRFAPLPSGECSRERLLMMKAHLIGLSFLTELL